MSNTWNLFPFTRNLLRYSVNINFSGHRHRHRQLLRLISTTARMSSTTAKTPAVPRLSASLLLINPRNEILFVHRPTHSSTSPNAHVFPGGATSPDDSTSPSPLKLCAIRETFEETGLLLTHPLPPPSVISTIPEARSQIHAGKLSFTAYLQSHNLAPALDDLIPFTTWITPKSMPRRFEAHMFLSFLPDTTTTTTSQQQQLPTSDGGIEILSTRFLAPQAALDAARRDELVFFPPQFYLLSMLAPYLSDAGIEDHSAGVRRRRLVRFAREGFGGLVMEPAPLRRLPDGRVVMGLGERGDGERVVVIQLAAKGEPRGLEIVGRGDMARL